MSQKARRVVMPAAGVLLIAALTLGGEARPLFAAEPDTSRTQTVTIPAGERDTSGTINLQGFVQPLDSRSLAPMHVSTSIVSPGGLEAGTLSAPSAAALTRSPSLDAGSKLRNEQGLIGGFAGYRSGEDKNPAAGYGINVQVASDPLAAADNLRLQPGLDYRTFLSPSWQLSSRLFSTYAMDAPAGMTGGRVGLSSSEEGSGFRDIGLSFGLGYAPSESWTVQTQAAYARQLRALESESLDGEPSTYQFFGGVIVNYKF